MPTPTQAPVLANPQNPSPPETDGFASVERILASIALTDPVLHAILAAFIALLRTWMDRYFATTPAEAPPAPQPAPAQQVATPSRTRRHTRPAMRRRAQTRARKAVPPIASPAPRPIPARHSPPQFHAGHPSPPPSPQTPQFSIFRQILSTPLHAHFIPLS